MENSERKKGSRREEQGWCTNELRCARMSSSKSLSCLKTQCFYFVGGLSPCIFAMMPEGTKASENKDRRSTGGCTRVFSKGTDGSFMAMVASGWTASRGPLRSLGGGV
jgi:hypothetical protein